MSWQLEPGLNFYRRMLRLNWMQPVDREAVDAKSDYFVALPEQASLIEKFGARKIYEDPVTHAVLAVRRR